MTLIQDSLFLPSPPKRPRQSDNPAYRPSRQYAEMAYAAEVARFRDHHFGVDDQPGCVRCHEAPETAKAKGTWATDEMCPTGQLLFRSYSRTARALRTGYYPDRALPAPAEPASPPPSLFDPEVHQ